ncbi:ImmA/IrrE family metallo-endopeptidase [Corynebacterium sp. H113]|uniref:ImmA/IrrE family metallo-endopeptidase n=1 Tax=Corynebacterium sp. H113 TaxID=3133419 RepID=UPI00309B1511
MRLLTTVLEFRKGIREITTLDLEELAQSMGLTIIYHRDGPKGWCSLHTKTISLRNDLTHREYRSTLAHEIGHAIRGDIYTGTIFDQRDERAADQFAAQLLISEEAYQAAERIHGPHDDAIAYELDVTVHLLNTWKQLVKVRQ